MRKELTKLKEELIDGKYGHSAALKPHQATTPLQAFSWGPALALLRTKGGAFPSEWKLVVKIGIHSPQVLSVVC
jgi:hypothetical protein